jgi:hypothetical protein
MPLESPTNPQTTWGEILMNRSLGLGLVVFYCATPAIAANSLLNPGFETGALAPWTNSNDFCAGCTWSVNSADAHSGTYSAVVDGNRLILQTASPIPVSSITAVSFWARHPDAATGADIAVFFEYSDASSEEELLFTTNSAWTFFDVLASLDSGKSLTGFGVYGNSGAAARFDDALIEVVPEPSAWLLLTTAAVWPVLSRRPIRLVRAVTCRAGNDCRIA